MNNLNPKVDKYLIDGCMRCKFGGTPQCKVNNWRKELIALREIVIESGLTEELKWGIPCYTDKNKNIVLINAFKEFVCLSFFKGALLSDKSKLLVKQGENSQSARILKFTNAEQIYRQKDIIKAYIAEAVENERSGKKIDFIKNPEPIPDELLQKFEEFPELRHAFYSLSPGRQRGYIIHFSQAKQSDTRFNRIEKHKQKILNGKGLNE